MINFFCPECKINLSKNNELYFKCDRCGFELKNNQGVWVNPEVERVAEKEFYDKIYNSERGQEWLQGLNRRNILKRILERFSLGYRRERFFRKYLKGKKNKILDLACGAGRDYFSKFGFVVGLDLAAKPLQLAKERYGLVVQSGIFALPFADNSFDYVASSDIFGHVRKEDKDGIIKEIWRVLKPNGRTLHVIETDSDNIWFKLAHKYPELFQKYFVEKIGGHVGLEMPADCVVRWERNGFEILRVIKICGTIWPIKGYQDLLGEEYKEKEGLMKFVVLISGILSRFKLIEVGVNILLNPINSLVENFTPLNNGQGLMMVCRKKENNFL